MAGWRGLWDSTDPGIRLATRRYCYDHRDGQAVRVLNHLHDKPIEMNVSVTMAEVIRAVRQRKQEYERTRK